MNAKQLFSPNSSSHIWSFSRVGGENRVNLRTGDDLVNLEKLDQKLWTALSCPVYDLEIDSRTLELIDADNDGRIRVPEINTAVKWLVSVVKNPDSILKSEQYLRLSDINDQTEDGKNLLQSAKQILRNLEKPDADIITVEDTSDTEKIFANTKFNGDGVITDISADDEELKKLIAEIISCLGSVVDRNGQDGITIDHIADFYRLCSEYSDWQAIAEAEPATVTPFDDETQAALDAFTAVKEKLEDFFLRCKLLGYVQNFTEILNSMKSSFEGFLTNNMSSCLSELGAFPIALPNIDNIFSLEQGINPAWKNSVFSFNTLVVQKLYPGKSCLTEEELLTIGKVFERYISWQSEKKGTEIETIGLQRVREILANTEKREVLESLVEHDRALEDNANNIILVDKLVRYHRDLFKLLQNYVTFYDFYSPHGESIFQTGYLYFDQRRCDLCMKVTDMAKHNQLAQTSGLCLIYCDCVRRRGEGKMTIVAALTDGDFDNIDVGRNGIFYDRSGDDWDATIVKIIDNPISIRQAFWSPYKKLTKFISAQVEKLASDKEKEFDAAATSGVERASNTGVTDPSAAPTVPQPFDIGKFVGIFAALSLAMGAIGSALVSIFTGFLSLNWWKMPLAVLGLILVVSGPSMIIAWLNLRKRNLAPLLDANGWAVNAKTSINIAFGATLTHLAFLPANSKLNLVDPFSKRKSPWIVVIIVIILLLLAALALWYFDVLSKQATV